MGYPDKLSRFQLDQPCPFSSLSLSHLDGGVRRLAPHPLAHVAPVDDGRRVAAPRLAPQRRPLPRHRRRGVRPDGMSSLITIHKRRPENAKYVGTPPTFVCLSLI